MKKKYYFVTNTRRTNGTVGFSRRKLTYAEIMEDLNNESDEFKSTPLYRRLLMKAEMIREEEEFGKIN